MSDKVMIKGSQYGIRVILDEEAPFSEIESELAYKFQNGTHFFDNANIVVEFSGRVLTSAEEKQLVKTICENSCIQIICLLDTDKDCEQYYKSLMQAYMDTVIANKGQFYRGNLQAGQVLESEKSVVIIGNVEPGAKIICAGNVIVIGRLSGTVFAGAKGNESAFVVAVHMHPDKIRIGDVIARTSKRQMLLKDTYAKIAFLEGDNICMKAI